MSRKLQHALLEVVFLQLLIGSMNAAPVPLWGRWEQSFQADGAAAPEVEFSVELTSPSGKLATISGFWDGGTTWRARFMPDEMGKWLYRTHSVPATAGLDNQTGEFVCRGETGTTRFLQHGAVRISPNGHYFVHADGTPFLWVGDTCWYGPILSAKEDWRTYLEDRTAKQFNVVHFNVVAPRNGVAADENGEVSFSGDKHIRINPRFYQRLDERVDAVNSHGLLAAIVLTWGLRPIDSGNSLPEQEVVRLIRYLESRYGGNHVVWIVTGDNYYEGSDGERWKRIGRAAFDGRKHAPVTTHPASLIWPWESFRDEKWLDFIIYQIGHDGDDARTLRWIHSGPPSQHWQNPPPRPFISIEPPYEGHLATHSRKPHSDYVSRRAIYWSLLNAPTAGVTYGAHGVWSWHTAVGQPPTDHPKTGVAKTWREALSFPGSTQMKYLEQFFTSVDWWELRPDNNLLSEQPGGDDPARHVSASRSEKGDLGVLYLPVGGEVKLRAGVLAKDLQGTWFDPRTGERTAARPSGESTFRAPSELDWVLLLRK
jgi:hypothetical protein